MKFINFVIVKFSLSLSIGIFTAYTFQEVSISFFNLFLFCFLGLIIFWIYARKQLFQKIYFGIFAYLCFFLLGGYISQKQLPKFQKNHYIQFEKENSAKEKLSVLTEIKVLEILKPDLYNVKYIAEIIHLNKAKTSGKILLNISKNDSLYLISTDDHLLIYSPLIVIKTPLNPHQFDYSKYMKSLGVYHQMRITSQNIISSTKGVSTLKGMAENFRSPIISKLKTYDFNPNVLSIMQALLLGQKRDIDKDLYKDYAAAGAVHILAVSGLHVGILYMILSLVFRFLETLPKGKLIKSISIVILLWGFATIAGLSPSVVRAVTMFSFFALAQSLERPTNSFNTLFLSYFFLLLIQPLWLFHVGFQMSYLAVLFILWIQPKLYKYYLPKYYLDKILWSIITVTFSAQLGILPLSIYYFHQVPGLSFLTNLIVLPFLGIVLGGGILVIILALLDYLPDTLVSFYNYSIELLNAFISWVANQDEFIIKDLFFSEKILISTYLLIFSLVIYWKNKTNRKLMFVLVCLNIILGMNFIEHRNGTYNQMIIFNKNRTTLLGLKEEKTLTVFKNDSSKIFLDEYPIKSYRIKEKIKNYTEIKLPNIWSYQEKNILIIDSLGVYSNNKAIDLILLIENPKINLNRLLDSLQPSQIVANGSNYPFLKNLWKSTCEQRNIPFFDISKEGAFTIE